MKSISLLLASITLVFFLACTSNTVAPAETTVTIGFVHLNNNVALELDKIRYTNSLGQDYSIKTVKYFISKVTFHNTNGTDYVSSNIHYVDIRDTETLSQELTENIPYGTYSGISFVFGLVAKDNVTGSLELDLDRLMEWPAPLGGGYHYMKLEGEFVDNNATSFFNFHTGALEGEAYEIHIDIPNLNFELNSNALNSTTLYMEITMEISNWFQNPTNWDFSYWGSGIMGNPEAQATVQKNGQDVFSIAFPSYNN